MSYYEKVVVDGLTRYRVTEGLLKGLFDDSNYNLSKEEVDSIYKQLIEDCESPSDVNLERRNMPNKKKVYSFWAETLVNIQKFDSYYELTESDCSICWGCGYLSEHGPLEMAHIIPRNRGGSDNPSNIHMLCRLCHLMSEHLEGKQYYDWFKNYFTSPVTKDFFFFRFSDKYQHMSEEDFEDPELGKRLGEMKSLASELDSETKVKYGITI